MKSISLILIIGALALCCACSRKPSDEKLCARFSHSRSEFVALGSLLERQKLVAGQTIDRNGSISNFGSIVGAHSLRDGDRLAIARLTKAIAPNRIIADDDGSFRFDFWGEGVFLGSETSIGILFVPDEDRQRHGSCPMHKVKSLADAALRANDGRIPGGFYASEIEPSWYMFRLEIGD